MVRMGGTIVRVTSLDWVVVETSLSSWEESSLFWMDKVAMGSG